MPKTSPAHPTKPAGTQRRPLRGIRVLSLALNLPGPAAVMRLKAMGAACVKLEPPGGDPMATYSPAAWEDMRAGVRLLKADLKSEKGQAVLHRELARADVLITSFRPSALKKLGLAPKALQARYPALVQIAIVGSPGAEAEQPGHDLTYMANRGLVSGTALPPTLYADMGGSLLVVEAVLQSLLARQAGGKGLFKEVALSSAVDYLALPRHWGLTTPSGTVGGAHAGYGVYACRDGRVAVAALEVHFARALCEVVGLAGGEPRTLLDPASRQAVADFFKTRTRAQLARLAAVRDIPLHTMK